MKISIYGTGFVGLVQSAVFANVGHQVVAYDVDDERVKAINNLKIPFYEPNLTSLVDNSIRAGTLKITNDFKKSVTYSSIHMITVGTPSLEDGGANLNYVFQVVKEIVKFCKEDSIIICKSTVPVGTCDEIKKYIEKEAPDKRIDIVFNPEFLREGSAVSDCNKPDRIIIGTEKTDTVEICKKLYEPFNRNHEKIIIMDTRSAELSKYAANCMLATKISFMNEMAAIADATGADIEKVRIGIGSDPRIGYDYIYAGCGFGGSCFPKDLSALINLANKKGLTPSLLNAVKKVNDVQKYKLARYAYDLFDKSLSGKVIQ
jgi:UDPglucose 6-dehydrogenase